MDKHETEKITIKERILQEPLLEEVLGADSLTRIEVTALTAGGSDRSFYRIRKGNCTFVLLHDENREVFFSFIQIHQFLHKNAIPVPRLYAHNGISQSMLLEDLGDETLFQKMSLSRSIESQKKYYQKVIDLLIDLQGISTEHMADCAPIRTRLFDYDQLRWETAYFTRYFLKEYCGISMANERELERGFHHLAESFANEPAFLMHRDFQSQNIMWKGGRPYLVDFQGARQGPSAYDLASLLHDCYVVLTDSLREYLISYYLARRYEKLGIAQEIHDFKYLYLRSALQRNMQALGAFSFLSLVKRKRHFERFISPGIEYLKLHLSQYPPLAVLEKEVRNIVLG